MNNNRTQWLTEFELVDLLRFQQQGRSLRAFARELGVTNTFLGEVLSLAKSPGEKIPEAIGYEEVKLYRPIIQSKREKK